MQVGGFYGYFSHAYTVEPIADLAAVNLAPGGLRAVHIAPFAKWRSLEIAVPEAAVEHFGKGTLEPGGKFRGKCAVGYGVGRLAVALGAALYILGAAGPALYLEHPYATIHYAGHELYGTQVLGRHYVLVVDVQLVAGFAVGNPVAAAAYLHAGSTVCRSAVSVQAHVTLAAYRHAKGAMGKHFYPYRIAGRAADMLVLYGFVDFFYLIEIKLAGEHHHISPAGPEAQGLYV